jgi:hypothetical protein
LIEEVRNYQMLNKNYYLIKPNEYDILTLIDIEKNYCSSLKKYKSNQLSILLLRYMKKLRCKCK